MPLIGRGPAGYLMRIPALKISLGMAVQAALLAFPMRRLLYGGENVSAGLSGFGINQ